jgi:thymidylate synthase
MNNLDKKYTDLLQDILDNGVEKKDRTGTGTISVFGRQIRHKMSEGFPLLTTKKMYMKGIITELLWFLRGDTNIKYLVDNDCHIWDGDAYKNYLSIIKSNSGVIPVSKEKYVELIRNDKSWSDSYGDLGPIYGKQWRKWNTHENIVIGHNGMFNEWGTIIKDQIANLIDDLKTNPDSRRLMVNAWNVGEIDKMVLPPCHYGFQVYTRELSWEERSQLLDITNGPWDSVAAIGTEMDRQNLPKRAISLMWNQRSCDLFLGIPFNIASYGLLLEILAKMVNMVPDELIGNLGDVHLYSNHIEQAKEQIGIDLTHQERIDWWFHNSKPNRDVVEDFDSLPPEIQMIRLNKSEIPLKSRIPFPLPTLKHMKTDEFYKILSEDLSMIGHLDNTDFEVKNYQSHPTIKAPLSN